MARVLIVDDEEDILTLFEQYLSSRGHDVQVTTDPMEAVRRMEADDFDVLITDILMPNVDGTSLLSEIHKSSGFTQVILMTAMPSVETAAAGLRTGAFDYLTKPIPLSVLAKTVEQAANKKELLLENDRLEEENRQHRKKLEERVGEQTKEIRLLLERYRTLVVNSPLGIFQCNREGTVIAANPAFAGLTGFNNAEDLLGVNVLAHDTFVLSGLTQRIQECFINGKTSVTEHPYFGKDTTERFFRLHLAPIRNDSGDTRAVQAMVEDITNRKLSEHRLTESERKYRTLFESANDAFLLMRDLRILDCNSTSLTIFGCNDRKDLVGKSLARFFPEDQPGRDPRAFQMIDIMRENQAEEPKMFEWSFLRTDGKPFDAEVAFNTIELDGNHLLLTVVRDVTERKQLENQLRQAQKLESIGQLAAGIAHELNTPIQYIGDNTRFLQEAFPGILSAAKQQFDLLKELARLVGGDESQALLDRIEDHRNEADLEYLLDEVPTALDQTLEGVDRVADIVRAMKAFSHPGTGGHKGIDLNRSIENTIIVARNEYKYVADLVTDMDPGLPLVPCDASEINQVILNLIVNAAHAISDRIDRSMGERGTITISSRTVGLWVEVRVSDTGTGIPSKVRERIFDPFFTTKEVGRGTGQGLAISRSVIVDKHKGTLHFETEENVGTTFVIRLPLKVEPHSQQ